MLEEKCGVQFEGMELAHNISQTGKPHKLPILKPVSSLCQLIELLLFRRSSCLLGQQLEQLWGRRVGDVEVVGERLAEGHRNRHPFLLHPSHVSRRFSPRFDIDWLVWVGGEIETVDELVDDFGTVLWVDGHVVAGLVVQLLTVLFQHHQNG